MAKARNHSAEYARRKAAAKALGYKSEREYKAARKHTGTKGRAKPPHKRAVKEVIPRLRAGVGGQPIADVRDAVDQWSNDNARTDAARISDDATAAEYRAYYAAFVKPYENGKRNIHKYSKAERRALRHYLVDVTGHYTAKEFDRRYPTGATITHGH